MPVRARAARHRELTPLEKAAQRQWEETLDALAWPERVPGGVTFTSDTQRRARILELLQKPSLTPDEKKEFKRIAKAWRERAARRREIARGGDGVTSEVAVTFEALGSLGDLTSGLYKGARKREKAQRRREQEAAQLAAAARDEVEARPQRATTPASIDESPAAPRRRRVRYGIVAEYDLHGTRIR